MNNELGKIRSFKDIFAWQEGHKLVLTVYSVTKEFPKEEQFGIISQMRRCAVSITSNIAEGFSRQSYKEKVQFYSMSLGSVTELQNQILIAKDVGYLTEKDFVLFDEMVIKVHKITNGLIKGSKSIIHNS